MSSTAFRLLLNGQWEASSGSRLSKEPYTSLLPSHAALTRQSPPPPPALPPPPPARRQRRPSLQRLRHHPHQHHVPRRGAGEVEDDEGVVDGGFVGADADARGGRM